MSFLPLLGSLALGATRNPFIQDIGVLALGIVTGQVSVRLGSYQISISHADGTPAHLTAAAALLAVERIALGQTGTFQSGVVLVTIAPLSEAPTPTLAMVTPTTATSNLEPTPTQSATAVSTSLQTQSISPQTVGTSKAAS